jgi:hypothetical protein
MCWPSHCPDAAARAVNTRRAPDPQPTPASIVGNKPPLAPSTGQRIISVHSMRADGLKRRLAALVLLWQVGTPLGLPAVASACARAREAAACCVVQRAGACPMHAKTATEAAACHMRCATADPGPLALIALTGMLPAPVDLANAVTIEQGPAVFAPHPLSLSSPFEPPPPRA